MDNYIYYIIAGAVIVISVVVFFLVKNKQPKAKEYELPEILTLLDKKNIVGINYIRNKIVIEFKDVTLFDSNQLHSYGAKGISIVGDKVKFYFDGDEGLNQSLYKQIKNHIEG